MTASPVAPESVIPVRWRDDERSGDAVAKARDLEDDGRGHLNAERRTYRMTDRAGNTLVLVAKVKRERHELKARIVTLRYNDGPVAPAGANELTLEWTIGRGGSIQGLEQSVKVGREESGTEVEARCNARRNVTTIESDHPERHIERAGLVLLGLATRAGALVIEY